MYWRIGEILIREKLLNWAELEDVLRTQKITSRKTGEILLEKRYISESLLYQALAKQHEIKYVDLKKVRVDENVSDLIPKSIAKKYRIFPLQSFRKKLIMAVADPSDDWPRHEIASLAQADQVECVVATPSDIEEAVETYCN